MEKNRKKKAGGAITKGARRLSAYKTLEAEAKTNPAEGKFQKAFGKAKHALNKG